MIVILDIGEHDTTIETADPGVIKTLRRMSLSHFDEITLDSFEAGSETWSVPAGWLKITIGPTKES